MTNPKEFILGGRRVEVEGSEIKDSQITRRPNSQEESMTDIGVSCVGPDSNINPHCSCVFFSKRDVRGLRKSLRSFRENKNCEERLMN